MCEIEKYLLLFAGLGIQIKFSFDFKLKVKVKGVFPRALVRWGG